jgi:hypothetical protein
LCLTCSLFLVAGGGGGGGGTTEYTTGIDLRDKIIYKVKNLSLEEEEEEEASPSTLLVLTCGTK